MLALVRGDHRLHELKIAERPRRAVPAGAAGRDPGGVRRRSRARSGRSAPTLRIIADESLRDGQFVGGANRTGWHLRGVEAGRDFEAEFADLREVAEGDTCAVCGTGVLRIEPAIEVGNIFKLGTRYSDAAGRDLPGRGRQGAPDRDGLLRHRPGPRLGRGGRAAPRREGHHLAGQPRAVPRAHGRDRRRGDPQLAVGRADPGRARARRAHRALRRPRGAAPARASPTPS